MLQVHAEFETLLLQHWPTEVPELQPAVKSLFDVLSSLGDRVLRAMAIGLGLVRTGYKLKTLFTNETIQNNTVN